MFFRKTKEQLEKEIKRLQEQTKVLVEEKQGLENQEDPKKTIRDWLNSPKLETAPCAFTALKKVVNQLKEEQRKNKKPFLVRFAKKLEEISEEETVSP